MNKKQPTERRKKQENTITECFFDQSGNKPDYKDILSLKRFTSDRGKILPQKHTGLCASHQRILSNEIKKARFMGLLPYTDKHAI